MSEDNEGKSSVIRSIFDWSKSRPLWQRDALRRIVQQVSLEEQDISELYDLLKASSSEVEAKAQPLLEEHLPNDQKSSDPIVLEMISDIKGVNNLAEGQEIKFPSKGIIVVYGDNGAGKSGYTRILKNVCRARHRSAVLPNVFSASQPTEISSLITYSVGDESGKEFNWQNDDTPHPELSSISVFDRECASVHIQKKNEVAYRPFGLDIPDTLAEITKALEGKLKDEKQTLGRKRNAVFQTPPWSVDTGVGKFVSALTKDTVLQGASELAVLTDEEDERLSYLNSALADDVSKASKALDDYAGDVESLVKAMESLVTKVDDDVVNSLIVLRDDAAKLQEAATVTATNFFADNKLSGVGEKIWQELWSSARKYSENVAYVGRDFPASEPEDTCLLCQQPLGEVGARNIKKFDEFVRSDIQDRANTAKEKFKHASSEFPSSIKLGSSWRTIKKLRIENSDLAKQCMRFYATAKCRVYSVQKILSGIEETEITSLSRLPSIELKGIAVGCREKAKELREAVDTEKRAALLAEKTELLDRKAVANYLEIIQEEIDRLKDVNHLDERLSETSTRSITTLGNSIADDVVTPHLRDSFLKEVIGFVGNRFRVEIKRSGGSYGSPEYKVSFLSDPRRDVSTVLSEGEQTCVAIASFLAEQSTASHKSTLIFDDPISSLDHKWRSIVAERLVKEGNARQVIIFTHDLVFLNDLEDFSARHGVPFESRHLDRRPEVVGLVNDSLPWDGMKITKRIDALEKQTREIARKRNDFTDEEYKAVARSFYSKLRTSWERALEEVGLSHTVMRHRDYINPKNLNNISALELPDCQQWSQNYGVCCDYVEAHDGSRGRNQALPEPDVLEKDVKALSDWVKNLKQKHKAIL
ncbi:MAG: AAA family ATPase [Agarilytica sp.]